MVDPVQDQWAQWLLNRRFGGSEQAMQAMMPRLYQIRDHVLQQARIKEGEIVLDVGCGDGLIAFGALEQVGTRGKVIFSDISQDLLDHCYTLARQMQVLERCQFLRAPAQELGEIQDQSVDVVTTRSVLIYVREKQQAFQHFYRILKPNGRLSIFEPINRFAYPEPPQRFSGYEVRPIMDLTRKMLQVYEQTHAALGDTMLDFDECDLFTFADQVGFPEVHLELHNSVVQATAENNGGEETQRWEIFLKSSPNPLVPTFEEVMQQALTTQEIERLTAHLRPLVERNEREQRDSLAYLWAMKR